jgi:hypothetical protein
MNRFSLRTVISASLLTCALFISIYILFSAQGSALAAHTSDAFTTPVALTGWLWAGAAADSGGEKIGMGWISLNCSNNNECATADYNVEINPDMTVTGYGWSPYTGWVKFGGLSGCPDGICAARVVAAGSDFEMAGWARACAVFVSGCSGALKDNGAPGYERGDWDGWVSLNCSNTGGCTTSNYRVTFPSATGYFPASSNAWGSDVMGRVNFSFAYFTSPCTAHAVCSADYTEVTQTDMWCEDTTTACDPGYLCSPVSTTCVAKPTVVGTLTANPMIVRDSGITTLTWDAQDTTSCTVTGSDGFSTSGGASGSGPSDPIRFNRTTYTLTCVDTATGIPVDVASTTVQRLGTTYES